MVKNERITSERTIIRTAAIIPKDNPSPVLLIIINETFGPVHEE